MKLNTFEHLFSHGCLLMTTNVYGIHGLHSINCKIRWIVLHLLLTGECLQVYTMLTRSAQLQNIHALLEYMQCIKESYICLVEAWYRENSCNSNPFLLYKEFLHQTKLLDVIHSNSFSLLHIIIMQIEKSSKFMYWWPQYVS